MLVSLVNYYEGVKSCYESKSQLARVITENWCKDNMYCPCCGNRNLTAYENNKKVFDFFCENCKEKYQLKSKQDKLGKKIVDGEYNTMINSIRDGKTPNFLFLAYSRDFKKVIEIIFVSRSLFFENNIEKRKPLSETARRAGWTGCNIDISNINEEGRVNIVKESSAVNYNKVIKQVNINNTIFNDTLENRSWLNDVLIIVEKQNGQFNLKDIYKYESFLKERHLNNNNIQAKIRQKLQKLRDLGVIQFLGNGFYKKV